MDERSMRKAMECRDGRVSIITGRDHKEFDCILHELALDHGRLISRGPDVILHFIPRLALIGPQESIGGPHYDAFKLSKKLERPEILSKLMPLSKRVLKLLRSEPSEYGLTYTFSGPASLEVFNTGLIESVDCGKGSFIDVKGKFLPLDKLYKECTAAVSRLLWVLGELDFKESTCVFLTLTNVKGIKLYGKTPPFRELNGFVFKDQDCKAEEHVFFQTGLLNSDKISLHLVQQLATCAQTT